MRHSIRMQRVIIRMADDRAVGSLPRQLQRTRFDEAWCIIPPQQRHVPHRAGLGPLAPSLSSDFVFASLLDISNILGQVELKPVDQFC